MKCPVCGRELQPVNYKGVEVDYCPACKGVWFDLLEIDKLSDSMKDFNIVEPRLENLKVVYVDDDEGFQEDYRKCPRCGVQMDKVMMNNKPPIFDFCPNDCGYWFDENELRIYVQNNMTTAKTNIALALDIVNRD